MILLLFANSYYFGVILIFGVYETGGRFLERGVLYDFNSVEGAFIR